MARDFDLGITGPPMSISMGFIAGGLVEMARQGHYAELYGVQAASYR